MAKMTVRQVEARLGVSYVVAAGIVSYLAKAGKATIVEKVFHESGKGKPTRVYEIDENVSLDLTGASEIVVVKKEAAPAESEVVETAAETVETEAVVETAAEATEMPEAA